MFPNVVKRKNLAFLDAVSAGYLRNFLQQGLVYTYGIAVHDQLAFQYALFPDLTIMLANLQRVADGTVSNLVHGNNSGHKTYSRRASRSSVLSLPLLENICTPRFPLLASM